MHPHAIRPRAVLPMCVEKGRRLGVRAWQALTRPVVFDVEIDKLRLALVEFSHTLHLGRLARTAFVLPSLRFTLENDECVVLGRIALVGASEDFGHRHDGIRVLRSKLLRKVANFSLFSWLCA